VMPDFVASMTENGLEHLRTGTAPRDIRAIAVLR
jgi:hypothetical protein